MNREQVLEERLKETNEELQILKDEIENLKIKNCYMVEIIAYIANSARTHTDFINGCEERNRRDHLMNVGNHISECLDNMRVY